MSYIDLDELTLLDNNFKHFGYNHKASYSFYDEDHFKFTRNPSRTAQQISQEKIKYSAKKYEGKTTKERILTLIKELKLPFKIEKIFILTNLRHHNYVFNPVSFYYCYDKKKQLRVLFSEVNNTWGDQKMYYTITGVGAKIHKDKQRKNFYISPFIDYDTDLHWTFKAPGKQLNMSVNSKRKDNSELLAVLTGTQEQMDDTSLKRLRWKYLFITHLIIIWIHFQALRLWLKKVPFLKKEQVDRRIVKELSK